jgi:signal transduction histidine kinase
VTEGPAGPTSGGEPPNGEPPPDTSGPGGAEPAGVPRRADGGQRATRREIEARIAGSRRERDPAAGSDEPYRWSWGPRGGRRGAGPDDRWRRGRGVFGPAGDRWSARGPRPPWWPAEEPWPPPHRRPWRGFGCLFGALFLAGVLGLLSIATSVVGRVLEAPGPFGLVIRLASVAVVAAIVVGLTRAARAIRGSGTILDALVEQAARVEAGDYSARVATAGTSPGPVESLARGFNTMAARLESDEAQRRTLLADVTHELRTPLAVVQGSVEAILDGVHPADETHLSAILEETNILDRLIEDLRTLALSESGALSLHREPTDLSILATDVATSFGATATAAGVQLDTTIADDLPLLDVDPVRIREVIGNLVANALRHTPPRGHVSIEARVPRAAGPLRTPGAAPGAVIEIIVRDTGPGIDAELLPHVFERFARGTGSTGSGLGLSIARGLVELHGGTIEASSTPGNGAEIRIQLPIEPPR